MFTIKIELYKKLDNTKGSASYPRFERLVDTKIRESVYLDYHKIQDYVRADTPEEVGATTFCGDVKATPVHALRLDLDEMRSFVVESPAIVYVMNEQGKTVDKITV